MLAVLAWGTWLAIGAVGYNNNPWRGVMVLGSVVVFLGGWLLLLWGRQRLASARRTVADGWGRGQCVGVPGIGGA